MSELVLKLQILLSSKFEYVISSNLFSGLAVHDKTLGKTENSTLLSFCYLMETKHAYIFTVTFYHPFFQTSVTQSFMKAG